MYIWVLISDYMYLCSKTNSQGSQNKLLFRANILKLKSPSPLQRGVERQIREGKDYISVSCIFSVSLPSDTTISKQRYLACTSGYNGADLHFVIARKLEQGAINHFSISTVCIPGKIKEKMIFELDSMRIPRHTLTRRRSSQYHSGTSNV